MRGAIAGTWLEALGQRRHLFAPGKALVLDFGFGDGRYFEFFADTFGADNVHGVEASALRVERARARGWKLAIQIDPRTVLPYPDATFDLVNMVEVIEHIPGSAIGMTLTEIVRVMKRPGLLLLTTPNYPIKRVYDLIDAVYSGLWPRLRDDPTHVRHYNHHSLRRLLESCFDSVEMTPYKEGILHRRFAVNFLCHKILAVCSLLVRSPVDDNPSRCEQNDG